MKYFAYGSNMSRARMSERVKHPVSGERTRLWDYRLVFNKPMANNPARAYANIVSASGEWVDGVVYDCTEADLVALDQFEGVHTGQYRRHDVMVGGNGRRERAIAYVGCVPDDAPCLPSTREYLDIILAGANESGFDTGMLARMKAAAGIAPAEGSAAT